MERQHSAVRVVRNIHLAAYLHYRGHRVVFQEHPFKPTGHFTFLVPNDPDVAADVTAFTEGTPVSLRAYQAAHDQFMALVRAAKKRFVLNAKARERALASIEGDSANTSIDDSEVR